MRPFLVAGMISVTSLPSRFLYGFALVSSVNVPFVTIRRVASFASCKTSATSPSSLPAAVCPAMPPFSSSPVSGVITAADFFCPRAIDGAAKRNRFMPPLWVLSK